LRSPFWADKEGVQCAISTPSRRSSPPPAACTPTTGHASAQGEAGFTLVELLIVLSVGLLLIAAISDFVIVSMHQANASSSRTIASRQAEVFLTRLTREVRQAQYIQNSTTGANETPVNVTYGSGNSSVSFYLPKPGSTAKGTQVTWTCTANASCTRTESGGATITQLKGVESAGFKPYGSSGVELASGAGVASSPSYPSSILISLTVKQISQQDSAQSHTVSVAASPITVQDGVDLRNYS
jgi:prepilin-type N-terminal cleavage/methylation domain-containing protein